MELRKLRLDKTMYDNKESELVVSVQQVPIRFVIVYKFASQTETKAELEL